MALVRFISAVKRLPWVLRMTRKWSQAANDIGANRFEAALQKLDILDIQMPNDPQNNLMRAYCNVRLRDYGRAKETLKNIGAEIAGSRRKEIEKKYLRLYSEYLHGYMADETGTSSELERIRGEAAACADGVPAKFKIMFRMQ